MRCKVIPALAAALSLASCGEELSEAEQRAQDEASVSVIRAANDMPPPLRDIVPEAISMAEIEANDLIGAACSYTPGTNGAVRLIARESDAVMKLNGALVRFAADPGSRDLPANTRTLYNGMQYALRLSLDNAARGENPPAAGYEGTIWLYDRWDRIVYTGVGAAQCDS